MSKQLIIGFITEGTTDVRFLESIIQRSFEEVAFECSGQVEILPVQHIEKQIGDFVNAAILSAQQAAEIGITVLCIHTDADAPSDSDTFRYKIKPALDAIQKVESEFCCRNLVPIVPIQMTEAWMLSDKALLKSEIGTDKSDKELGIEKAPETYSDPKEAISKAIRIARQDESRRRRHKLSISGLYSPLGQKLALKKLEELPSYQKFKDAVRDVFRALNYLY